jgi:hypothetical protein
MNFQLGYIKKIPSFSLIPLKKGILWKVTKDTIDTKNEELFNYARLRLKSLILHLCIRKKNNMHLLKRKKEKNYSKEKFKNE